MSETEGLILIIWNVVFLFLSIKTHSDEKEKYHLQRRLNPNAEFDQYGTSNYVIFFWILGLGFLSFLFVRN